MRVWAGYMIPTLIIGLVVAFLWQSSKRFEETVPNATYRTLTVTLIVMSVVYAVWLWWGGSYLTK